MRLDFWLNEVTLLPPRHILVVIDACHSGVALDAVVRWRGAALSTAALDDLQARRSRRIITSALDDQLAMDGGPYPGHSLFTGCLIAGLTGGIAAGGQRVATGSQIGMYLQQRVRSYPRSQQTPDFGALDLDQRGEIVVPLLGAAREADTEPALTASGHPSGPETEQGATTAGDASVTPEGHAPQLSMAPAEVVVDETSVMQVPAVGQTRLAMSSNKALRASGALVVLLGCAATGYAVTRKASSGMSDAQSAAMASAVARLDGDIRAARTAVRERAITLSLLSPLRAAIGNGPTTLADEVKSGELEFSPNNGEILELSQVVKATNTVVSLMVRPAGAMRNMHDGVVGSYADVVDNQLVITEVVEVVPKYTQDEYRWFLSVTRPLALTPALKPLVEAGITGKLVVADKSAPIGAMPPQAITRDLPLASGVKLIVTEPPPRAVLPLPLLVGGVGAVVIGLLLLVITLRDRHHASSPIPSRP